MTNNGGELPTDKDSSDKTFNKIEGVARKMFPGWDHWLDNSFSP